MYSCSVVDMRRARSYGFRSPTRISQRVHRFSHAAPGSVLLSHERSASLDQRSPPTVHLPIPLSPPPPHPAPPHTPRGRSPLPPSPAPHLILLHHFCEKLMRRRAAGRALQHMLVRLLSGAFECGEPRHPSANDNNFFRRSQCPHSLFWRSLSLSRSFSPLRLVRSLFPFALRLPVHIQTSV